ASGLFAERAPAVGQIGANGVTGFGRTADEAKDVVLRMNGAVHAHPATKAFGMPEPLKRVAGFKVAAIAPQDIRIQSARLVRAGRLQCRSLLQRFIIGRFFYHASAIAK